MGFVGIDFGTTNSAVAIADDDGGVQLVPLIADLAAIDGVLDDVLARARLAARFGADKLVGGEELTSVAWGLAARARAVFG